MARRNPSISISFSRGKTAQEINALVADLKNLRKEFEVSNTAIEASGDALGLAQNKLKQYGQEAEKVKTIINAIQKEYENQLNTQSKLASKTEIARQAYENAAKSENKSKEEVAKLKKEYEDLASRLAHANKSVTNWKNALQNAQITENKLTKATNDVNREITELNKKHVETVKNTQNATTATGQLLNIYTLIKGLALSYAGRTLFEALIGSNAQFEQYMASFEVLLGGAEKAQKRMDELTIFAAKTPFELSQVVEAEKRLLAYGVAAEDTAEVMQMLGDISMGNAEKLNMISLAYGQVVTNQRLYGTELRQFAENGVPLLAELAEMYGVTEAEMREMVSDGQISADAVTAALKRMTSEGGQFYGMMEKQSQTMEGLWSTLKDNISMFARDVGDESFGYLKRQLSDLMDKIDEMAQSGELGDLAAEWGNNIAKFVEFVVEAVKVLWDMKEALIAVGFAMAITKTLNALAKGFETLRATVMMAKAGFAAAKVSNDILNASLIKSPWGAVAAVIGIVVGALATYDISTKNSANETERLINKTKELNEEYENSIKSINKQTNAELGETETARKLAEELETLANKTYKSAEEKARMVQIVDQLNEKVPNLSLAINSETGELNKQISVVYDTIEAYKQLLFVKAAEKKSSAAAGNLIEAKDIRAKLEEEYNKLMKEYADLESQVPSDEEVKKDPNIIRGYEGKYKQIQSVITKLDKVKKNIKETEENIKKYEQEIQRAFDLSKEYAEKYGSKYNFKGNSNNYTPPLLKNESGTGSTSTNNEAERARQEAIQKQFSDLKFYLDMGYITEAQYYQKLAQLRDAYYSEGSTEWQQYTLEIKQYQDDLVEKAIQAKKDEYTKRRQLSDQWIQDEKYYNRLSVDDEIAAYERIKAYAEQYYKDGVITYEQYVSEKKNLDKQIYDAERRKYQERRQLSDQWIQEQKEAGKLSTEEEIAAYERIKTYTEQFYKDGILSYEEYIDKIKELDKNIVNAKQTSAEKQYENIFAGAETFIDTEEFYDRALAPEKQIEIYEGLKKIAEEYYQNGTKTYEEYLEDIVDLDKKIYSVRKKALQEYINEVYEEEKAKFDKIKDELEQEEKEIKESYNRRKKEIEDYYDELDLIDARNERAEKLAELQKEEEKYLKAVTKEGKEKLKQIQEQIKELNKEAEQEQRSIDKKKELEQAERDMEEAEAARLKRIEELNKKYETLDNTQKKLLENIGKYATASAGILEEVTKKIQTLMAAVTSATTPSTGTPGTSSGTVNTNNNVIIHDYGDKILSGPEDVEDYGSELGNAAKNALLTKGVKTWA